ncbi:glycosyltransferase [Bacteroides sp.]|uniref:glycosyltransferase n=1 Tax=Bacteroides sp. TaxID=29523 RepID=UPI0035273B39
MTFLIFDLDAKGHHLEYIHHLYSYGGIHLVGHRIVFVLHPDFKNMYSFRTFCPQEHIDIIYLKEEEVVNLSSYSFKSAYKASCLLKKYINLVVPDTVFLNTIISFMPFLPIIVRNSRFISGIEYTIPDRRIRASNRKKIKDYLKLFLYAYAPCFKKIYLLNDSKYPIVYNKKFRVNKFLFLPDPYVPIYSVEEICSISNLITDKSKCVFLHCGGMGIRKGTFNILEAIETLSIKEKNKSVFVFAGVISDTDMREKFSRIVKELSRSVQIIFIERFLKFEELAYLFELTNYVLVPYQNVENSSGIIGYAAQFNKPVIGPSEGLLGELISSYNLGYTITNINADRLREIISKLLKIDPRKIDGTSYLSISSLDNFSKIIYGVKDE